MKEEATRKLSDEALQVLVQNHRRFRAFLSRRVGSETVAEDLLQQSLKKAIEHPAHSLKETSLLAWFYDILKTTLVDHYRSAAAERRKHHALGEMLSQDDLYAAPLDGLESEVCQCLKELLPTLKSQYAEILQRVDLNGESPEKAASELKITRNNLDVRLYRARQAMKQSLLRSCGTCTEHGCLNCTCHSNEIAGRKKV